MVEKEKIGPFELGKVHQGDCLELMKRIPDNSFDAVITDPPYMFTTSSSGGGKLNPWADMMNAAHWYAVWYRHALRIAPVLWSFCNWRTLATIQKAAYDIEHQVDNCLIWHKEWIGPGGMKGLRPSYEMVVLIFRSDFRGIHRRDLLDMQSFKWSSHKPNGHPAEKPIALMAWLIDITKGPQEYFRVLDPFAGSGTTMVAAKELGCEYMGFDRDPKWIKVANDRLSSMPTGLSYKDNKKGQQSLFTRSQNV